VVTSPRLPEFFVVGSARSGTTSLRWYLLRHPQLFLPRMMEPRYFAFAGDTMEYCGPMDQLLRDKVVTCLEDYTRLYNNCGDDQRAGDVSPAYLCSSQAAGLMRDLTPEARIIAILRHPVERAFSSFRLERLDGVEPEAAFDRALALENARATAGWAYVWRYRERGLYAKHLRRYYDNFPHERIRVYLYDDWKNSRGVHLLADVLSFLGVSPIRPPSRIKHLNSSHSRRFGAAGVAEPILQNSVAERLLDTYQKDFDELETMIGRDLSHWRSWPPAQAV